MLKYHTQGVCASEIDFEIENGLVKNVHFTDQYSSDDVAGFNFLWTPLDYTF